MKETIYEPKRLTLRAVNNTLIATLESIVVFPSGKAVHNRTVLHPNAATDIFLHEDGDTVVAPAIFKDEDSNEQAIIISVTISRLFTAVYVKEKGINKLGRLLRMFSGQHRASDDYDFVGAAIDIDLRATLANGQVLKGHDTLRGKCGIHAELPYTKRIMLEKMKTDK